MNNKTKQKNTEEVKQVTEVIEAIKKVVEKKEYNVGDDYILNTEVYKVVEVLGNGNYHLKNTKEPFNSFLTTSDECF